MSELLPPSRRRWIIGVVNCLAGAILIGVSIFAAVQMLREFLSFGKNVWNGMLAMLFFAGIGAALVWIGVGDIRGCRRPSWLVRVSLFLCFFALVIPILFVIRDSLRKQRVNNNLNQLRAAIGQYESTFKLRPAVPAPAADETDPNK